MLNGKMLIAMNRSMIFCSLLAILIAGCQPAAPDYVMPTVSAPAIATEPVPTATPAEPTPTATPTLAPEPLLGTPENPAVCAVDDFYSGKRAGLERETAPPIQNGARNDGFKSYSFGGGSFIEIDRGSVHAEKLVSVCEIPADFLGMPNDRLIIIGLQVLNEDDNSFGLLHIAINRKDLPNVVRSLKRSNGKSMALLESMSAELTERIRTEPVFTDYQFWLKLYDLYGPNYSNVAKKIRSTGIIPSEAENMIWLGSFINY